MKVIIATGPARSFGAIVIDHSDKCFWRDGKCIRIGSRRMFRLVAATLAASPQYVDHFEMIDHIWGDDPGGGPLQPQASLLAARCQHRSGLKKLGIDIRSRHTFGWRVYEADEPKSRPRNQGDDHEQSRSRIRTAAVSPAA